MSHRWLLSVLALSGALLAPRSALAADPFYALSPQEPVDAAQAQFLADLGAGMTRIQVCNWPAGRDAVEAQVNAARAAGLAVMLELNYCTIDLSSMTYAQRVAYWHQMPANGNFDSGNTFSWDFTNAAREVARYFRGRVAYYEIWNEPDVAPEPPDPATANWDGACGLGPNPYLYYRDGAPWGLCPRQLGVITTNSFDAITAEDPAAKVVAGNVLLHGANGWVGKEYWKQVEQSPAVSWHINVKQAGRPWHIVGIHPYHSDSRNGELAAELDAFRGILNGYGDGAPLAITEYGRRTPWQSGVEYSMADNEQADVVRTAFQVARQKGLSFLMWFNYMDAGGDTFGLRKANWEWKPSAPEYCQVAGSTRCPSGWSHVFVRAANAGASAAQLRVHFATDTSPALGEDKVLTVTIPGGGGHFTLNLNMLKHPLWRGRITALQVTPVNQTSTFFMMDFVRVCEPSGSNCIRAWEFSSDSVRRALPPSIEGWGIYNVSQDTGWWWEGTFGGEGIYGWPFIRIDLNATGQSFTTTY